MKSFAKSRLRSPLLNVLALSIAAALSARAGTLVALYQFNDSSDLGLDSSGNGNNLNVFGSGVSYSSNGEFGGGLVLAGSGGLTTLTGQVPSNGSFPIGNADYSISVDFETTTYQGAGGFIGWGAWGAGNEVNALRTNGNGFRHYWWGDDLDATPTSGTIYDGDWHNVTVTFDGTTRDMYLDGVLINSNTPTGTHNAQNENFHIGVTNNSEFFQGELDDVAVFNQALTQSQVSTIAAGNFSAFGASSTPEPSSWLLGVGAGALLLGLRRSSAIRSPQPASPQQTATR